MFIINPDPYSLPAYRIGPFRTSDIGVNHSLPDSDLIDDYFRERFNGRDYFYTYNGRSAISLALEYLNPSADEVVTILTTSGNFYISSCVTNEIEKFCRWSREIVPETRIILVNHEFGYPFTEWSPLMDTGLPIIEDCAGSFFSTDRDHTIGRIGDFVIYSFPKMFPMQIGGLLVSSKELKGIGNNKMSGPLLRHIKNALSHYIPDRDIIIGQRLKNYQYLKEKFFSLGFSERFRFEKDVIPNVFMFRTESSKLNLPELKTFFWAHGVQCSVFYGEEAFFIPCHQALIETDLDYFFEVMKSFLKKRSNEVC